MKVFLILHMKAGLLLVRMLCLISLSVALTAQASAQQLEFAKIAASDEAELSKAMPTLAKQIIANYKEEDRQKYLNNLFRLQIIAGD